jgi:hypothetical protein
MQQPTPQADVIGNAHHLHGVAEKIGSAQSVRIAGFVACMVHETVVGKVMLRWCPTRYVACQMPL